MNVLIINGGMPKGGNTELLTKYLSRNYGFSAYYLSEGNIPVMTGDPEQWELPAVKEFIQKVEEADGIILISPEYHGGMTGALKNALDFLTSQQLAHKPTALLATAGGGKGGINCLNNMRTVMRGFYANVIPRQLILDPDCFNYPDFTLWDEAKGKVEELAKELIMYVKVAEQLKPSIH